MQTFSVQAWLPKAEFRTTKSLLMQDLVFRLGSSVIVHGKKKKMERNIPFCR